MSAPYFGPGHKKTLVNFGHNVFWLKRTSKTGPTGSGTIFVNRTEKRLTGNNSDINAFLFIIPIGIVKGQSSTVFLGDFILQRG